jgi:hypothetical protein
VLARSRPYESPFAYLAFDSEKYGRSELERLRALQGAPNSDQIRDLAGQALNHRYTWQMTLSSADFQARRRQKGTI